MRIGVISDTHGRLESRVFEVFEGVERILHAGDVGGPEVLAELSALAPVTAVWGNTDVHPLSQRLREVEVVETAGIRFLVIHQAGSPERPTRQLRRLLGEHRPDVVIFGHTHAPCNRVAGGVRFLNPGGAGPRRFGLPRTVAVLEISPAGLQARFVDLDAGPAEGAGGGPT